MPVAAIKTYVGRVRGEDGFSPIIELYEDTPVSCRLRITDQTHTFLTPNLLGSLKRVAIEVPCRAPLIVPLTDLGLDPAYGYLFYATAGIDYPYLRAINAIRVGNAVQVSVYCDTKPYTAPRLGSPFVGGFIKIGAPGLKIGDFYIGEQFDDEPFPVNLLCFAIE
jgi:hypothetical protein